MSTLVATVLRLLAVPAIVLTISSCEYGPFTTQAAAVPDAIIVNPNDPIFANQDNEQWYLDTIRAPAAWGLYEAIARRSYTGGAVQPVVVSVIDSGIVAGHEDLAGVMALDGIDFVDGAAIPIPAGSPAVDASAGHGTHVAGLIAAQGGNGRGIAGATYNGWPGDQFLLRPVTVLEYDSNSDATFGNVVDVIIGMVYASGADSNRISGAGRFSAVMNLSLGTQSLNEGEITFFENAIESARQGDVLLVAAAGNAGIHGIDYPARFSDVIAVGSIDADQSRSDFSNFGPEIELVAPGAESSNGSVATGIVSTFAPTGYRTIAGTSMATPLVAAAAALVRSANPYLSAAETRQILRETARDLGAPGWDAEYGYGLVDMEAALRRALSRPYGRFSSSGTSRGAVEITPRVPSADRLAEYDRARAEASWDPAGRSRVSVLLRAGSDADAIAALPGVRRVGQTPMPDGILLRLEMTGAAAATFETLRTEPAVLLVHQERLVQFSSAHFLQSRAE